jgi:O-antigen/teichoic acid export membrane protein
VAFVLGAVLMGLYLWSVVQSEHKAAIQWAWLIFLAGATINILGGGIFAALYGLGDVATERIIRSISLLCGLGLAYLSLYFGYGIVGLAMSWVIQNLIARIVALWALYANHPWLRNVEGRAKKELYSKIAAPSLKWAAMGFGAILILQTDNIIIASMLGTAFIPQYEAVAKMAVALMTLSLLIVNSSTPFLSKAYAAGQHEQVIALLLRNVRISMFAMAILVPFIALFGEEIINIWLGTGNFVGNYVLWTMLVMVFLEVHHVSMATATMATGRIAFMWAALLAGLLNILISLVLARYLGLWGVALGTMIAQILTNNWYAPYLTLKHFGVPLSMYLRKVVFPVIVLILLCLGFDALIKAAFHRIDIAFVVAMLATSLIMAWMMFRHRASDVR